MSLDDLDKVEHAFGRGWTMVLGDCVEVLRATSERVDHTITDPPYEAEAHTKFRTTRAVLEGRMADESIDFAPMDAELRAAIAAEIVRLTKGWALAFCQIEGVNPWRDAFVAAGMKWRRAQVWIKPDSAPQFTGDRPAQGFEAIASAWCGEGKSVWNGGGRRGVYVHNVNAVGKNEHPTTKPLPLMIELVDLFTQPDDLVLDPFAGSGSTGVACLQRGRRFVGIDRDPKYFAIAVDRLRAEEAGVGSVKAWRAGQLGMFGGER